MIPVLSYGMGVESTAILLRWIFEPETRRLPDGATFDLADLTVITAQLGDEFKDTGALVDSHIIPLLRQHSIRYVQISRAGASQADGYVVLEDSKQPMQCFLEGKYKLSDEMRSSGTVPQYSGVHKCSLKHKAFPIEAWLSDHFYSEIAHAFGYNFEELRRVEKSEKNIAKRNVRAWQKIEKLNDARKTISGRQVAVSFGFNAGEPKRVLKGRKHDHLLRVGFYPLVDWKWSREDCKAYIQAKTGVSWHKSTCAFCPFSKIKPRLIERHKVHPAQIADALLMEQVATAFNPRAGSLYKTASLYSITTEHENTAALAEYETKLHGLPWAVYRVRRIRKAGEGVNAKGQPKKGATVRCVQIEATGTETEVLLALAKLATEQQIEIVDGRSPVAILSTFEGKEAGKEEFFVAAPALASEKVRSSFDEFDEDWDDDEGLYCGPDDLPLFSGVDEGEAA